MAETPETNKPDFRNGFPIRDLGDGSMISGEADGEELVLTRRGDEFFAVGAHCAHYGGPLAEGLIVGDTVRCPWHHACFSLRDGEALPAPALNPVSCWRVERHDRRIHVGEKVERNPLAATYPGVRPKPGLSKVVIIGAGAAGTAAAEMLRRCGFTGDVTVVDDDDGSPYDRPNLSKDYLAGNAPEEWIPIRPVGFYDEHRVTFIRARVTKLEPARHTLHIDGRAPLGYDALILATGAEPAR